ncbi:Retinol dehydrogenase 12like, partial [Caligus rogercresseyi]
MEGTLLSMCSVRPCCNCPLVQLSPANKNLNEANDSMSGKYLVLPLDLQSLESVRSFAAKILEDFSEIAILINNAGIMLTPYEETKDGFESQFQTNYLSHFLLTSLLLDKIQNRIVNVSSCGHKLGYYCTDWNDLQKKEFYTPEGAYGTSKAAVILFTRYLQIKINESPQYKGKISVFSLHPGMIYTDLYVNAPSFV